MATDNQTADDFVLNPQLMKEVELSQATGAQARFMTFLQRVVTLLLGSHIVYDSRWSLGFIDNGEVYEHLCIVENFSKKPSREVFVSKPCLTRQDILDVFKTVKLDPVDIEQFIDKPHKSLLWCLRKLEEELVKKPKSKKIKDLLLIINNLFDWMTEKKPTTSVKQNSLVLSSVVANFRKTLNERLQTFEETSQYSHEQLNVIKRIIPRLNIMVVSEIIASFNLTMANLGSAVSDFKLFSVPEIPVLSTQSKTVKSHLKCARHKRNWSNHTLELKSEDHVQFVEHAVCIMEFIEPWFRDTETDEFKELTPDEKNSYPSFVFPGLWENYARPFAQNVLSSYDVVKEIIDRVVTLNEEKKQMREEFSEVLAEKDQKLADAANREEYWRNLYINTTNPPETAPAGASNGKPQSSNDPQLSANDIPEVVEGTQDIQLESAGDEGDE